MILKEELFNNINKGVVEERIGLFGVNLNKNLELIKKYGGLQKILADFSGKHAIIIGAGPSLDDNISILKKIQFRNELVIVATDMSVRSLMKQGIRPSYVFSCETAAVDFFSDIDTQAMHLVAFSCMSHSNLRKWHGKISFYNWMLKGVEYKHLWERAGEDLGYVATASIITTQAVAMILGVNVESLILVGNDLGFVDRFYAKGTVAIERLHYSMNRFCAGFSLEMNKARFRRDYQLSREDKVFYTNHQFLAAKIWLEELFEKTRIPVYDCGIPGCSGKYVKKVTLSDYLNTIDVVRKRRRG